MELNAVELALKEIYDSWQLGNECENNGYSAMFRMGFPDEYIKSGQPLLMYVGQEDLNGNSYKTQEWVRKYQLVQMKKNNDILLSEKVNSSPFWEFYRILCNIGYNCLWNNLDKFLYADETHLLAEDAIIINSPYGGEKQSIFQREIALLKPNIIVLAIGPRRKYRESLAAAFSVDPSVLYTYRPTRKKCVQEISSVLGMEDTVVLWTYHPKYLRFCKLEHAAIKEINQAIESRINIQEE